MITDDFIWQAFRDLSVTLIGSDLSQTSGIPSIQWPAWKAGNAQSTTSPEYPYLVLDVADYSSLSDHDLINTIDASDQTKIKTLQDYLITFYVYGYGAREILRKLKLSLEIESNRDSIRTNTGGAIREISDPTHTFQELSDRYLEVAELNLVWGGANEIVDSNSTIIETTQITYN